MMRRPETPPSLATPAPGRRTGRDGVAVLEGGAGAGLRGTDGPDLLQGTDDPDLLRGGAGDDTLRGGRGRDTLAGDAGSDWLEGGGGADTLAFRPAAGGMDLLSGGGGRDTLLVHLTAAQAADASLRAALQALRHDPTDRDAAAALGLVLDGVERVRVAVDPALPRVDLAAVAAGVGGFAILGEAAGDWAGVALATTPVGDLDGDGLDDLLLGAFLNDAAGVEAGAGYVVFGKADGAAVDLGALGAGGWRILGATPGDRAGRAPAVSGDLNGDGLPELLIGAGEDGMGPGAVYVVFGKRDAAPVDLAAIAAGEGGFVIRGELPGGLVGRSVADLGDWNGDGRPDLLIGAPDAGPGRAYVVFGRAGTAAVDLADVAAGRGGFVLRGEAAGGQAGLLVAAAGDVNGDGAGDLLIGAPGAGLAYVVFGGGAPPPDLAAVARGQGGFVLRGEVPGDLAGFNVTGLVDVNADGRDDVVVGAYGRDTGDAGRAYVVFGRADTAPVELADVARGIGGFVLLGEQAEDRAGINIARLGDLNRDGLADLVVGASRQGPGDAGAAYVVFGKTDGAVVDLALVAAGQGGFRIDGADPGGNVGRAVALAGDVNGDDLPDLLVGGYRVDGPGGVDSGAAYVVFGQETWFAP